MFAPELLRKYENDPLPGQPSLVKQDQPQDDTIEEDFEYEVERILDSKLVRRKLFYQVKWLGWDDDDTWYPASNFDHAPSRLLYFHDKNPSKPGPPAELEEWIKQAANGSPQVAMVDVLTDWEENYWVEVVV